MMRCKAHGQGDLTALENLHRSDEEHELQQNLLVLPRPLRRHLPAGGHLSASQHWLERLYARAGVPQEKKTLVIDHLRCYGPWMVSIDQPALSILDGMSQTATMPAGFSADSIVMSYAHGEFDELTLYAQQPYEQTASAYAQLQAVLGRAVPGFRTVSVVSSGAEANEKALALCYQHNYSAKRKKLLAFEGGFHGRTLLALHATANAKKRGPFEFAGYEAEFLPFPVCPQASSLRYHAAPEYLAALGTEPVDHVRQQFGSSADALLQQELQVLSALQSALQADDVFACIVEPMQSEGGDRYATARFFQALRVLTQRYGVALIVDEVQTGFGLSGTFCWHHLFSLQDASGGPLLPDCVTFAKRAQVGIVLSNLPDPEQSGAHAASMLRGALHAQLALDDDEAPAFESTLRKRLSELGKRHPQLVSDARCQGYAMAFDLPTAAHLAAYLGQRMWRGAMVFGAGDRTVRYRLSPAFAADHLDLLFQSIDASLTWLSQHPGDMPPAWPQEETHANQPDPLQRQQSSHASQASGHRRYDLAKSRIRVASRSESQALLLAITELEERVYEPARRDPISKLALAFDDPDGIAVIAEYQAGDDWKLIGCCLATPLEQMHWLEGPDRDPMLHQNNTLYVLTLTLDPEYHGLGMGYRLKRRLLQVAAAKRTADDLPRYHFQTGRNRVGHTAAMRRLNRGWGGYELYRLKDQYGEPGVDAVYYRIHLQAMAAATPRHARRSDKDLASTLANPFATAPASLREALDQGQLFGPTVNKLTLCNYVTPAVVRANEWIAALYPSLNHMYLTSSRDECVDKTLRSLRWHRRTAQTVIGFNGGYVGHTTAAARSISDPGVHHGAPPFFDHWPRIAHPNTHGLDATLSQLRDTVSAQRHGAAEVLAVMIEAVQERTGQALSEQDWEQLRAACQQMEIPIVLVETTTAYYRSGSNPFCSSDWNPPDAMIWWPGGQLGIVHIGERYFVSEPLTLVSTWDGDELSLIRAQHQLRAARRHDCAARSKYFDSELRKHANGKLTLRGRGLYRVAEAGSSGEALATHLKNAGFRTVSFANGCVPLALPLDISDGTLTELAMALGQAPLCAS